MTDIEITREYIQTGLREEIELLTHTLLNKVPKDASQFQPRKGLISGVSSADLIAMEMDETLQSIVDGTADVNTSIEQLTYLFLARMVAARVDSGAVLGSRSEAMAQPVEEKPKQKARKPRAKAAAKTEDLPPAEDEVTEPETTPVAEVLESNQDFLAGVETVPDEAPTETPEVADEESVELAKADLGVLDLL